MSSCLPYLILSAIRSCGFFKGRWLALVQPWPGTIWAWPGHPATQTATRPSGHGHGHPASRPPDQHANSHRPSGHMPAVRPRPRPSGQPATPSTCKLPGHRPRPRPGHGHTRKKSILGWPGDFYIFFGRFEMCFSCWTSFFGFPLVVCR